VYSESIVLGKSMIKERDGGLVDPAGWTCPAAGVFVKPSFCFPSSPTIPSTSLSTSLGVARHGGRPVLSGSSTRWFLRVPVAAVLLRSCGRNQHEHPRFRGATAAFAAGGFRWRPQPCRPADHVTTDCESEQPLLLDNTMAIVAVSCKRALRYSLSVQGRGGSAWTWDTSPLRESAGPIAFQQLHLLRYERRECPRIAGRT
jgi:hypothetical protein